MHIYHRFMKSINEGDTLLIVAPAGTVKKEDIQLAIVLISSKGLNY